MITTTDEAIAKQIEENGIIGFYSSYGRYDTHITLSGDADIHMVGEALRAFLLATGFSESLVKEILDLPE